MAAPRPLPVPFPVISGLALASLILEQVVLHGGLIDLCVPQGTLHPMAHLLTHGRDWNTCCNELGCSTVTELVNGGLDSCGSAIFLPGFLDHRIIEGKRRASIPGIAPEDGAGGNMALFEVPTQQTNTLWSCREHHCSFALSFAKDAVLLIILCQHHITILQGETSPTRTPVS